MSEKRFAHKNFPPEIRAKAETIFRKNNLYFQKTLYILLQSIENRSLYVLHKVRKIHPRKVNRLSILRSCANI